ncbi:MAG: hypothetical protein QNJ34_26640 [Xenococcaceae cyanobacterium MO_188.B29]|nr:hypothetical protein [Xenococcaceae cyanobacterium MO_188.B29]
MKNHQSCHHCQGLGYIEIRDCAGEIQREETCSFCGGLGYIKEEEDKDKHCSS